MKRVIADLHKRPSFRDDPKPKAAYQQIIQEMEKQGAWLLKFRWGEDTAVLLCTRSAVTLHPRRKHAGSPFRRYTFGRIVGPKRWLDAAEQVFREIQHRRRDIYLRQQHGGKTTVIQRPWLATIGAKAMLEDEMMCWHGVAFDTYAEVVTLDQDPQVIV